MSKQNGFTIEELEEWMQSNLQIAYAIMKDQFDNEQICTPEYEAALGISCVVMRYLKGKREQENCSPNK